MKFRAPSSAHSLVRAPVASIQPMFPTPKESGSAQKSACKHLCWLNTPCRTIWNKKESSMQMRSEEHTSELQSLRHLVCRLLLEKKKKKKENTKRDTKTQHDDRK